MNQPAKPTPAAHTAAAPSWKPEPKKRLHRSFFEKLTPAERMAHIKAGGIVTG